MKHVLALVASLVFGACVAAIVASVAFPHVSEFSYAPPIIVFSVLSVWVSLPTYVVAMVLSSVRAKEPSKKKDPAWGVTISTSATLIASIAMVALFWFKETQRRADGERHWAETQDLQRRNPHALVNDIALPDEEDSGYRIRFVGDKGVVRASNKLVSVTPYVVLPPGKHWVVLHGDTAKAGRLKLEWFLQGSVEVEAGRLYKLQVADGHIRLVEVTRFKENSFRFEVRQ